MRKGIDCVCSHMRHMNSATRQAIDRCECNAVSVVGVHRVLYYVYNYLYSMVNMMNTFLQSNMFYIKMV